MGSCAGKAASIDFSFNDLWLYFEEPPSEEQREQIVAAIEKIVNQSCVDSYESYKLLASDDEEDLLEGAEKFVFSKLPLS